MKDLINLAITNLGRLLVTDVLEELEKLPAMSILLEKRHVRVEDSPNHRWRHCSGGEEVRIHESGVPAYVIGLYELLSQNPKSLVDLIQTRRKAGVVKMLEGMEQMFHASPGANADPKKWQTVFLKNCWMYETVVEKNGNFEVFIDCTFCFEPMPVEEESDTPSMVGCV